MKDCVDFYYKIPTCILDIVDYIENDSLKEEAISLYVRETFLNEIKTVSSTQVQIQNGETKTNVKLTINFVVYKGIINKIEQELDPLAKTHETSSIRKVAKDLKKQLEAEVKRFTYSDTLPAACSRPCSGFFLATRSTCQ